MKYQFMHPEAIQFDKTDGKTKLAAFNGNLPNHFKSMRLEIDS